MTPIGLQRETGPDTIRQPSLEAITPRLESDIFFPVSAPLTKRLALRVEEERDRCLEESRQDPTQIEDATPEEAEEWERAMQPKLVYSIAIEARKFWQTVSGLFTDSATQHKENVQVGAWQKLITKELYYHLAFLAAGPQAQKNEPFSIANVVTSSMGNLLGLDKTEPLLAELAQEFSAWLKETGEFQAGWGSIRQAGNDGFYLEMLAAGENEEDIPSTELKTERHSQEQALTA
jgi:hypothetical protein